MRRLACAAILLTAGCQAVFAPFMGDPGDGGPPATNATTGVGGINHPDLSTPADAGELVSSALILLHSSQPSFASADFNPTTCLHAIVANCDVFDCPPADLAVAGAAADVGTIHVAAVTSDFLMIPISDGSYSVQPLPGPIWNRAGAIITVSATGSAAFAAFSLMTDGPAPISVTTPLAGSLDVARSADLDVSWADGTTGQVIIDILAGSRRLRCPFGLAAGSALVPRLALAQLPAGDATLSILVTKSQTLDNTLEVRTETPGQDSNGLPFVSSVKLQ